MTYTWRLVHNATVSSSNPLTVFLQAHKNCQNMTEIEAKVNYVKLARSLKTYGVSFFLVKVRRTMDYQSGGCF